MSIPQPRRPRVQEGPVYVDLDLDDLGTSEGRVSALVVHEPGSGPTRQVALAVAEGVAAALEGDAAVAVAPADRVDPASAAGVRLLFVGVSTHAVRGWVGTLPVRGRDAAVATFDTRPEVVRDRPAPAATAVHRLVERRGWLATEHATFSVPAVGALGTAGTPDALLPGEEERAAAWGRRVAGEMRAVLADRARG